MAQTSTTSCQTKWSDNNNDDKLKLKTRTRKKAHAGTRTQAYILVKKLEFHKKNNWMCKFQKKQMQDAAARKHM